LKRVHTADNVAEAWHIRNVLVHNDIEAVVKNDRLYSVAGEIPITECLPEVWVSQMCFSQAEQVIRDLETANDDAGADWICRNCKESNGGNFSLCWNCQTAFQAEA